MKDRLEKMTNTGLGQLLDSEVALGLLYQQEIQETLSRALRLGLERVTWRPAVYQHLVETPRLVRFHTAELFALPIHSTRNNSQLAAPEKQTSKLRTDFPEGTEPLQEVGVELSEHQHQTGSETLEGFSGRGIWEQHFRRLNDQGSRRLFRPHL